MNKTFKLYEVEKNSKIYLDDGFCVFLYIDGFYSVCRMDKTNEIVHFSANTPLESYLDGFKIIKHG